MAIKFWMEDMEAEPRPRDQFPHVACIRRDTFEYGQCVSTDRRWVWLECREDVPKLVEQWNKAPTTVDGLGYVYSIVW